ncbi:unnamed protein product [Closterium sp. Yama58-4]|nr:unnamed protein product [Closterium sp. Yama58-4]
MAGSGGGNCSPAAMVLDQVVLKLNPTRTRCEVVTSTAGRVEVVCVALLRPLAQHIEAVEREISAGAHVVILDPRQCAPYHRLFRAPFVSNEDAAAAAAAIAWFSKGTLQRVLRFINSPALLEQAVAITQEITSLTKSLQRSTQVDLHDAACMLSDRAQIPGDPPPSARSSRASSPCRASPQPVRAPRSSSRSSSPIRDQIRALSELETTETNAELVERLRRGVEARRGMLKREREVAVARSQAAGFTADHLPSLLAFADCFGMPRFRCAAPRGTGGTGGMGGKGRHGGKGERLVNRASSAPLYSPLLSLYPPPNPLPFLPCSPAISSFAALVPIAPSPR